MSDEIDDEFDEEDNQLSIRSGEIKTTSKLVVFLYELIRQNIGIGDVEFLVRNAQINEPTLLANGWLAKYAEDIAERLK